MVIVVHPRLAGVEVWWWDAFGAAVFAYSGGPAGVLDERLWGLQARVSSSMLVLPPSSESLAAWWTRLEPELEREMRHRIKRVNRGQASALIALLKELQEMTA